MKPTAATVPLQNPLSQELDAPSSAPRAPGTAARVPAPPRHDPINEPAPVLPFLDPGRDPEWTDAQLDTLLKIRERVAMLDRLLHELSTGRLRITSPAKVDLVASQLASVIQTFLMILQEKDLRRTAPPLI